MYIRVRLSHVCLASSLSRHDTLGPKGTHGVCRAMCFHIFGARHTAEANPTRPLRILAQEVGSELRLRCVLYYAQKGCPWSRPRVSLSIYLSTALGRDWSPRTACTLRSAARARSLACRVRFLLFCFASCRRPQSAFLGEPQASALRMGLGSHQAMRAVSVSRPSRPVASVSVKVDGELARRAVASLPHDHTPARMPALRRPRPRPRPRLSCRQC